VLTQLQELFIHNCQLQEPEGGSVSADTTHWQQQQQQQKQQQHLTAHQDPSGSSSSRSGQASLGCLTSLTALSLGNVKYGLSVDLAGLSVLTGLQQLLLGPLQPLPMLPLQGQEEDETQPETHVIENLYQKLEKRQQQLGQNAVTSLYQLSRLTQLELHTRLLALPLRRIPGLFAHIQQLRELKLLGAPVSRADVLQDLPASVTKLELAWRGGWLSSSTVPALAHLTSMQHLVLEAGGSGGFDPSLISNMQQLRVLSLTGDLQQHDDQAAAAAGAPLCRLLDALSQLSKLETLAITRSSEQVQQPLPAHETAKYAALLSASAHLTQLQLCWEGETWLPNDCWQHVFAAGVQLPQLKELWVGLPMNVLDEQVNEEVAEAVAATSPCFGPGDVDRLVQCCPALEYLSIPGMVEDFEDVTPLAALTALTGLFVGGDAVYDDNISAAVAPLTRLQHLLIYHAPNMTDQGLLALSALRQLTVLVAWECGFSEAVWDYGYEKCAGFSTNVRLRCALLSVSAQGHIHSS
jgi:hypothetical protein